MARPARKRKRRHLPIILIGLGVSGLGAGAVAFVRSFLSSAPPPAKQLVQEIHVIRPPPPPPDLPPPPPPPEEEKVEVPDPQKPDPTPSNEPPPGEQLGLDAEGGAGGDAFGLLGHKGGRDLLGAGGSVMAWYAGLVKNEMLQELQSDIAIRSGSYSATMKLWLRPDGSVENVRLAQSTGDPLRDKALESALGRLMNHRFSQPPPAGTPEPFTLRIVSRG